MNPEQDPFGHQSLRAHEDAMRAQQQLTHRFVARDVAGDDYLGASFTKKHMSDATARAWFNQVVLAVLREMPEDEHTPQELDLFVVDASSVERQYARIVYDGPPGDWYVETSHESV